MAKKSQKDEPTTIFTSWADFIKSLRWWFQSFSQMIGFVSVTTSIWLQYYIDPSLSFHMNNHIACYLWEREGREDHKRKEEKSLDILDWFVGAPLRACGFSIPKFHHFGNGNGKWKCPKTPSSSLRIHSVYIGRGLGVCEETHKRHSIMMATYLAAVAYVIDLLDSWLF